MNLVSRQRKRGRAAFTLIELLVAMAILSVIVLALTHLFSQSTKAWDSGWRRSMSMMTGRVLVNHVQLRAALAVCDEEGVGPTELASPSGSQFGVLFGTNAPDRIGFTSSGGGMRQNSTLNGAGDLFESGPDDMASLSTFGLSFNAVRPPSYADVGLTIRTDDKGRAEDRAFSTRVYLINRHRYHYE